MAQLGLGLGLGRRRAAAYQTAAQSGQGEAYLATHDRLRRRIQGIDPGSVKRERINQFTQTGQTPWLNPSTPTPTPPVAGTPDPNAPPTMDSPAAGTGGTPGNTPLSMSQMAEKFAIKTPQELEAVSQFAMGNLPKVAQFDNSAYEEQFNRLMQQSQQAGDINAASIKESYGSRGARYGSDIGRATADMQRKQTLDLQSAGFDIRNQLNDQRLRELSGTAGALQSIGASKGNILQSGMQDMWKAYGVDMAPPDMWNEMFGYAQSFDAPAKVVY